MKWQRPIAIAISLNGSVFSEEEMGFCLKINSALTFEINLIIQLDQYFDERRIWESERNAK